MTTGSPVAAEATISFLAPWVDNVGLSAPLQGLVRRAMCDVGIMEAPPRSNRGRRIDYYNQLAGVPMGSPYCASALYGWSKWAGTPCPTPLSRWWRERGLQLMNPAQVDAWIVWAEHERRWTNKPGLAHAVVYGNAHDRGTHIGLVVRAPGPGQPDYRTFEANTTTSPGFSVEGDGFEMKWLRGDQLARVTGYINLGVVG